MDTESISRERDDAEITDLSTTEGPSCEAPQSGIPEVSVCLSESDATDLQMCPVRIEENPEDNSPFKSHSCTQLHQKTLQGSGYHSLQHNRCPSCGHHHSFQSNVCKGQTNAFHQADCSTSPVKTVHGCSPSRLPSCHNKMQCHWLHGPHDGSNHKPLQHHMVTVRNDGLHWIPRSYSQVIVEYPLAVLISCTVLLFACSLAGILSGPLPDFSDPLSGFEPRGTDISIRLATWMKLQENTGPGKSLSPVPRQLTEATTAREDRSLPLLKQRSRRMLHQDYAEHNFFCNAPGEHYAQLVFRSGNSASLWSLKAIYSMCQMEETQIRSGTEFDKFCQVQSGLDGSIGNNECCPSWSLGNYLASLNNVSSCFHLTTLHVSESLSLLRFCAPYYHDGSLVASCTERSKSGRCASVPHRCKLSSIFQILHYLVDKDFLGPQTVEYKVPSLKYSALFLPVDKGDQFLKIYLDHLEGHELTYNNTFITGMDLGIKQKLFKYYLARDSIYPVLAALGLLFTMGLYLRSLLIAAMSLVAVILSLCTSYFFYKVAFRLTFFPLLNLTSVLVLLGSCLNHTLTFVDFWKLQLSHNPPAIPEKRMNRVLQEMGYLILVSGLTSSITFYSGYISSITAIRCYAVYLGSASLINTFFALVWLPCTLILQERYAVLSSNPVTKTAWNPCCSKNAGGFWETSSRKRCLFTLRQKLRTLGRGFTDTSNLLFLKILPCGVVKFRYIWICWFTVLAAGGTYISCVDPGMKLTTSDSKATQLFRSSHPFERYDAEYRHQFMFERVKQGEDEPMTLTLIWGVIPSDNGDHFNPKSNASLAIDPAFNMSSLEAQVWLRDLCGKIKNQSFYSQLSADQEETEESGCFVESLIHWVSIRRCSESEDAFSFCCNNIPFPYPPSVFEQCLSMMVAELYAEGHLPNAGALRFDSEGRITALVILFKSIQRYSFNYSKMSQFYQEVLKWFNAEISKAPVGLQKGWFVSQLGLYDLQRCLSSETLQVAGFSVALTFALLLLTTWNIPLSIYVSLAVGGSVFATVGLLVLLEWQLNGVEALFISAAAGLSVDFVANYCISYSLAPHNDRLGRVAHSLKRMGCPVATGAGAYFCVGILMLPATALLFRKLGIFLLLVKCVACGFATFFFQSLCCFFGPQKKCGNITIPCVTKQATENNPAAETGTASPSANGAFGCGTSSRIRRNFNKENDGFLCPNQEHHRKRQTVGGKEPEQYELQPLACQLSDSFENSTCTSKLSNRPSVLSDDIQFCGHSPRQDYDRVSIEADSEEMCSRHLKTCNPPPALQTSSPYKENMLRPVVAPPQDLSKEKILCKKCRGQSSGGLKLWDTSLSSSSSMEEIMTSQTTDTVNQRSLSIDEVTSCHKQLLSCQSQSSMEGLEDSNETCLSDVEPAICVPPAVKKEEEFQPGHLNGKRDTLRLSLKETVFDLDSPGTGRGRTTQSGVPVILPNSKPDMPDVWIKREGKGGS
ncbi:protein dispatched homolog 2 [Triplophysa rosa]|uniref:Protein dispatched-like protein 2 n=1 Tax=Triplophysa rosa TaxID=992332 RepID=A0A9W7WJU3_TRIRA|nr:protein dispatched homolog 2 [Triplophysa rosa]KAI7804602.1 protein dispatched-like protein 2 [Triplophysa rosa]